MSRGYQVGEKIFNDLQELSEILGIDSVTKEELENGKYSDKVILIDTEDELPPINVKDTIPKFSTMADLKGFIKDLDTPTLEFLAKGLGVAWEVNAHVQINRMRIAMAMQRYFFPEQFKLVVEKKKTKLGDFSTEELFSLASKDKIEIQRSGNEHIDRMNVILALKKLNHILA